jgi:hypothetical protein
LIKLPDIGVLIFDLSKWWNAVIEIWVKIQNLFNFYFHTIYAKIYYYLNCFECSSFRIDFKLSKLWVSAKIILYLALPDFESFTFHSLPQFSPGQKKSRRMSWIPIFWGQLKVKPLNRFLLTVFLYLFSKKWCKFLKIYH